MERRRFNAMLGAIGLSSAESGVGETSAVAGSEPESFVLRANGWVPNNAHLPVVLYRAAIPVDGPDPGERFEQMFQRNGWPAQWRDGVYDYHHYHSTAHEVLGFARGSARLVLGGDKGRAVIVKPGDVAVLPVGIGHCKLEASSDFLVIGAYPPDQHRDICRSAPSQEAIERMARLPFPKSDPVRGSGGPITQLWSSL